ncbi:MAG: hypothetical protein GXY74_00900 [Phycisphaerae bacterium]|nr:hypothetical protein [Phycisphaerae bacterium]
MPTGPHQATVRADVGPSHPTSTVPILHVVALIGQVGLIVLNTVCLLLFGLVSLADDNPNAKTAGVLFLLGAIVALAVNVPMLVLYARRNGFAMGALFGGAVFGLLAALAGINRAASLDMSYAILAVVVSLIVAAAALAFIVLMLSKGSKAMAKNARPRVVALGVMAGLLAVPGLASPLGVSGWLAALTPTAVRYATRSDAQRRADTMNALRAQHARKREPYREQGRANLHKLHGAISAYAAEHQGWLPPDLRTLVRECRVSEDTLRSPLMVYDAKSSSRVAPYSYFGQGLRLEDVPPGYILVAEPKKLYLSDTSAQALLGDGKTADVGQNQMLANSRVLCHHRVPKQLTSIAEAALAYARAHGNRFPPDLDALLSSGAIDAYTLQLPDDIKRMDDRGIRYFCKDLAYRPEQAYLVAAGPRFESDLTYVVKISGGNCSVERLTDGTIRELVKEQTPPPPKREKPRTRPRPVTPVP